MTSNKYGCQHWTGRQKPAIEEWALSLHVKRRDGSSILVQILNYFRPKSMLSSASYSLTEVNRMTIGYTYSYVFLPL